MPAAAAGWAPRRAWSCSPGLHLLQAQSPARQNIVRRRAGPPAPPDEAAWMRDSPLRRPPTGVQVGAVGRKPGPRRACQTQGPCRPLRGSWGAGSSGLRRAQQRPALLPHPAPHRTAPALNPSSPALTPTLPLCSRVSSTHQMTRTTGGPTRSPTSAWRWTCRQAPDGAGCPAPLQPARGGAQGRAGPTGTPSSSSRSSSGVARALHRPHSSSRRARGPRLGLAGSRRPLRQRRWAAAAAVVGRA